MQQANSHDTQDRNPQKFSLNDNPFRNTGTLKHSAYYAVQEKQLVDLARGGEAPEQARFVHSQLRSLITDEQFSCLGGRSAFNRFQYRFGLYPKMNSTEATDALIHDLYWFVSEQESIADNFTTFVASFDGPTILSEEHFESSVWSQLNHLHSKDLFGWDPTVSSDPASGDFSFSICGRAFFIVGLHPVSERYVRRFAYPTLVFNAHYQFDRLRDANKLESLKKAIRQREEKLQGSLNPNLSDFGNESEARQYSGRKVEPEWKCPFQAKKSIEVPNYTDLGLPE